MNASFILPLSLFLGGLVIRSVYELAKKRSGRRDLGMAIFLLVLAAMMALWIGWFAMAPADPVTLDLSPVVRWCGLAVTVAGWIVVLGALLQLKGVENIQHLVTTGLYRKFRHPMYTGFLFWLVGWPVFHGAAASFIAAIPCILAVLSWRRTEDLALEVQFGGDYEAYRKTTWF